MHELVGYFEGTESTPSYDPGDGSPCLVCTKPMQFKITRNVTISLAVVGGNRSYFFRCHKDCWDGLSEEEQSEIEGSIIDRAVEA